MNTIGEKRRILRDIYDAAVAAAHPAQLLPRHLPPPPGGRIIALAAGKAAGAMIAAAEAFYLDTLGLPPEKLLGLGVTRDGYGVPTRHLRVVEAGHPLPNEAGLAATADVLALAESAGPDDLVLALISGGGSANWIAPAGKITLPEKQSITKALLRSGAPIGDINTLRKHLSRIKGGGLARAAQGAQLLTLAISDVPDDDPSAIASGPTVPDPTTQADARAIALRWGIELLPGARTVLDNPAMETPKPGDAAFARATYSMIARPADGLRAAGDVARAHGYETILLGADLQGEARIVAEGHARLALELARQGKRCAILSGGELTVTIAGSGRGGPNQEYALALAIALADAPEIAAMAGDTDGTDGGSGLATDPAGAFCDGSSIDRARALKLDAAACLAANNSTGFFESLNDLLSPGPTRTNINDIRAILTG